MTNSVTPGFLVIDEPLVVYKTTDLTNITEEQWSVIADYVQRVAWLGYYHGATRSTDGMSPEAKADEYTWSGFDMNVVRVMCITNQGRIERKAT